MSPFKLSKWLSFTASKDWFHRYSFANAGLRSISTDLGNGTVMHCWVPKCHKQSKPTLLLIHGFGANAMWQYGEHLRHFTHRFNVYVPDLLFFGRSFTARPERTESFQASCVMKLMEAHGVPRMSLVGISYGGFVAYSMAVQFPEAVERAALCCAGVCLEEKDMEEGLFRVTDLDEAVKILVPQAPEELRRLMRFSFVKPARGIPSFFLSDFIDVRLSHVSLLVLCYVLYIYGLCAIGKWNNLWQILRVIYIYIYILWDFRALINRCFSLLNLIVKLGH
jgi:pimeloyl-ACP methyl ester carboxylesterase